jgi:hypothetical protein
MSNKTDPTYDLVEDIAPYDVALLARIHRFNWKCWSWYFDETLVSSRIGNGILTPHRNQYDYDHQLTSQTTAAPTIYQLQKWFRKKHRINVEVTFLPNIDKYKVLFIPMNISRKSIKDLKHYTKVFAKYFSDDSFSEAEEAMIHGLSEAFKQLETKVS